MPPPPGVGMSSLQTSRGTLASPQRGTVISKSCLDALDALGV